MRKPLLVLAVALLGIVLVISPASAQSYSFQVPEETVDVYLEADGSMRLVYRIVFANDPGAAAIDFVDVGLPTDDYDLGSVRAWIGGQPISSIETSPYVTPGIALGLGGAAIPAGRTGEVIVEIPRVGNVLYAGDEEGYASAKFSPSWFDGQFAHGSTDLTVTFHLPPGVEPEQPRWHTPGGGWPDNPPAVGFDEEGRIVYSWRDTSSNAYTQFVFGASFPSTYVPPESLQTPVSAFIAAISSLAAAVAGCSFPLLPVLVIIGLIFFARNRSRLAYLPPRISVEGHGIKRGLTAVEASVLLQTGLDKVLTMVLFGVIRKGGARVVQQEPLKIEALPAPTKELRAYETAFVKAAVEPDVRLRQRAFSDLMIDLVRAVQTKMKGFSTGETRDYYRAIMRKAWAEVEAAGTPEVRSERYSEGLEWLMLDGDFDSRTRRTFTGGPVYVPVWWSSYSPARPAAPAVSGPSAKGTGAVSLPHLPGADFAASMASSVQNSAGALVGNVTAFTQGVAKTTNPPPVARSYSGSRSGGGCACACACAGCACACAGGGR
ncbi:MAG TPA: hypothetical protein VI701_02330 [Anaerolineales bacterium]|nr:hypothetical protein [Anaerolineales bacterium]